MRYGKFEMDIGLVFFISIMTFILILASLVSKVEIEKERTEQVRIECEYRKTVEHE